MPDTRTGDPGEAAVLAEDAPPTSGTAPTAEDAPTAAGPLRVRAERWTLVLTALVAVLTIAVAAVDVSFPGRAVLALVFTLAVPGVPLASLLRIPNALLAASLAGALSIATWLLVATAAVSSGTWNPLAWSTGVAVVGLVATVPALRRLRSWSTATGLPEPLPRTRR